MNWIKLVLDRSISGLVLLIFGFNTEKEFYAETKFCQNRLSQPRSGQLVCSDSRTYHPVVSVEFVRVSLAEERDTGLVEVQGRDAASTVPNEQHAAAVEATRCVREALRYVLHALDKAQRGMDQAGRVVDV